MNMRVPETGAELILIDPDGVIYAMPQAVLETYRVDDDVSGYDASRLVNLVNWGMYAVSDGAAGNLGMVGTDLKRAGESLSGSGPAPSPK
jgi:hypothetical protein